MALLRVPQKLPIPLSTPSTNAHLCVRFGVRGSRFEEGRPPESEAGDRSGPPASNKRKSFRLVVGAAWVSGLRAFGRRLPVCLRWSPSALVARCGPGFWVGTSGCPSVFRQPLARALRLGSGSLSAVCPGSGNPAIPLPTASTNTQFRAKTRYRLIVSVLVGVGWSGLITGFVSWTRKANASSSDGCGRSSGSTQVMTEVRRDFRCRSVCRAVWRSRTLKSEAPIV